MLITIKVLYVMALTIACIIWISKIEARKRAERGTTEVVTW